MARLPWAQNQPVSLANNDPKKIEAASCHFRSLQTKPASRTKLQQNNTLYQQQRHFPIARNLKSRLVCYPTTLYSILPLATVVTVRNYIFIGITAVGLATTVIALLEFLLSLRLRHAERFEAMVSRRILING